MKRSGESPAETTKDYVVRYWPRLLSFYQQLVFWEKHGPNTLIAPKTMGPEYRAVVAINDDTLYASAFVHLRDVPVVLTIPPTAPGFSFSLLVLDVFGTALPKTPTASGSYALVPSGWQGKLPAGLVEVPVPYPVTIWNLRADKYADGVSQLEQAEKFRVSLRMAGLPEYLENPDAGRTTMLPIEEFKVSVKLVADDLARDKPRDLLELMQEAVHSPSTKPLDGGDLELALRFDAVFAAAKDDPTLMKTVTAAVGEAWASIQDNWKGSAGATGWIHPTNLAEWGTAYLDRASGNEFIQYGNNPAAAGYWHAFVDEAGQALTGARGTSYRVTFTKDQVPDAKRFWSVTAYTPDTIELIDNTPRKYVVAEYTPGLERNPDDSLTVHIAHTKPDTVHEANWLPVGDREFNVMLRVYGPEGNTAPDAGYVPPPITMD